MDLSNHDQARRCRGGGGCDLDGISVDRAPQVFRDLKKVKARGDAIIKDPAFVAIAEGLGITPQRLLASLRKVKEEIREKPKDKVVGGFEAR